jgi:predicted flap endonuclease-1-like 5' DNA nuclease
MVNSPEIQVLLILGIIVLFVVLEWLLLQWLRRRSEVAQADLPQPGVKMPAPQAVKAAPSAPVAEPVPPAAEAQFAPSKPDDLKLIEGIGPKIAGILAAAGITTFAQLAATDGSRLKEIIAQAGLTALADPASWPEQAALAAAGKLDELNALQDQLKGGRRVS